MTYERWHLLMHNDNENLTAEEIAEGWHFCNEFDGLLVGPKMGELQVCKCLDKDPPVYNSVPKDIPQLWNVDPFERTQNPEPL